MNNSQSFLIVTREEDYAHNLQTYICNHHENAELVVIGTDKKEVGMVALEISKSSKKWNFDKVLISCDIIQPLGYGLFEIVHCVRSTCGQVPIVLFHKDELDNKVKEAINNSVGHPFTAVQGIDLSKPDQVSLEMAIPF